MAGVTHSNDTTGISRRANGFRYFLNNEMTSAALSDYLGRTHGNNRNAYHLAVNTGWGGMQQQALQKHTEENGWNTTNTEYTDVRHSDFSQQITNVLNSDADTLFLNYYGATMIQPVKQAVQRGLWDRQMNGKDFVIVVPVQTRLATQQLGEFSEGIVSTSNWDWTLPDEGSKAFVKSFGSEYGYPPSEGAHTCYLQTLLYADACERAGTFTPSEVVKSLEGYQFDGVGLGLSNYRKDDHQCFKGVPIVKGKGPGQTKYELLDVVDVVAKETVEYSADLFGGDLGQVRNGTCCFH